MRATFSLAITFVFLSRASGAQLDAVGLQKDLATLTRTTRGRLGVCVQAAEGSACVHATDKFPMQSVMKLFVGFAVLDAIDHKGWRLAEPVVVHRDELSLDVQPLAKLVGDAGFRTTIGDLVRRAIIDSDSAATDFLIARLGGAVAVQSALQRLSVMGIRVDRDERHLQTEFVGLTWKPEYVDAALLDRANAGVPAAMRARAFAAYQRDPRDTATPAGMSTFLWRLAKGELLSRESTEFLIQAMKDCATFPNRLKAGIPVTWEIAHKTGTSGMWKGVTAATNDVAIVRTPDGSTMTISAFVADSPAPEAERAALIAAVSRAAVAHFR